MSQDEFTSVRGEIKDLRTETRDGFDKVDKKFDEVNENLGSLTKVVLGIRDTIENDGRKTKERITRIEETVGISE